MDEARRTQNVSSRDKWMRLTQHQEAVSNKFQERVAEGINGPSWA